MLMPNAEWDGRMHEFNVGRSTFGIDMRQYPTEPTAAREACGTCQ